MTKASSKRDWNDLSLTELFDELCVRAPSVITQQEAYKSIIDIARQEDLDRSGDLTSRNLIDESRAAEAVMRSRGTGRLAGLRLLLLVAAHYDRELGIELLVPDGEEAVAGATLARVNGKLQSVLAAERVMLNFVCHLSGIATLTARYVDAVKGTDARIYDTRKTIPGMRHFAKYAVRCGGGYCHRLGLSDAMLIKDNHIAHIPAPNLEHQLRIAIDQTRRQFPELAFVEIEVDTLEQLERVLTLDVDIVLLDNFDTEAMRQAVAIRDRTKPQVQLEASGGINLGNVRAAAETGVERIAVGAITHSAPALDIALDIAPA